MPYDKTCEMLPTRAPAVIKTCLLPSDPSAPRHRTELSDCHSLDSQRLPYICVFVEKVPNLYRVVLGQLPDGPAPPKGGEEVAVGRVLKVPDPVDLDVTTDEPQPALRAHGDGAQNIVANTGGKACAVPTRTRGCSRAGCTEPAEAFGILGP
jgi:hypothetical protein